MSSGERPALVGRVVLAAVLEAVFEAVRQLIGEGPQDIEQYQQPEAPVEVHHETNEENGQADEDVFDEARYEGPHARILAWRT